MDPVALRPLQSPMTRESTETSRLVTPDRLSGDDPRERTHDEDELDDFIAGELPLIRVYIDSP